MQGMMNFDLRSCNLFYTLNLSYHYNIPEQIVQREVCRQDTVNDKVCLEFTFGRYSLSKGIANSFTCKSCPDNGASSVSLSKWTVFQKEPWVDTMQCNFLISAWKASITFKLPVKLCTYTGSHFWKWSVNHKISCSWKLVVEALQLQQWSPCA